MNEKQLLRSIERSLVKKFPDNDFRFTRSTGGNLRLVMNDDQVNVDNINRILEVLVILINSFKLTNTGKLAVLVNDMVLQELYAMIKRRL